MNAIPLLTTLDSLAPLPRWIVWRNEERNGDITKVPYVPGENRRAKSDDPTTWRTHDEAEAAADLVVGHLGGGVGIELGDLADGRAIGGIDLDTCRGEDGRLEEWATEVIQRIGSYAEVSPSGTGAKVFFRFDPASLPELLCAMQTDGGKQWKRGKGKHPPSIELYVTGRYFAVTRQHVETSPPDLRLIAIDVLLQLIMVEGPAFAAAGKAPLGKPTTLRAMVDRSGNDSSRSGTAFRIGARARREGSTFEQMCDAIRTDPETAGWYAEKGLAASGRELRRIWDKVDPETIDNAEWTEDGVARAFVAKHQDTLRHDHDVGRWFEWNGYAWREDRTARGFSWARVMCREVRQAAGGTAPDSLAKAATAGAVERFARSDPAMAVTTQQWDQDPWLLGTPGGTVDLRTGQLRAANPDDAITKLTAVAPSLGMECPRWLQFLEETTGRDHQLIRFLRQWIGYCLTGVTREHALLFVFGPGGNGKSVLLSTVSGILGDYARTAPMEAFVASPNDRHATELAMLRGARLVTASETEEGRAWAEVRIKQLTGGDVIAARFMRQDFFEYRPQFKLTIVGNHKPVLRNIDEAARRRFNVVPFLYKPETIDRDLEQKLKAEWPGILRWAIEGCLDWQRNGLIRPPVVSEATEEYFQAQDSFSRWIDEACVRDTSGTLKSKPSVLLQSFNGWLAENGEQHTNRNRFRGQVERTSGLRYVTIRGSEYVAGIGIKPDDDATRQRQGGDGW